jgi:hypothetical protein
VVTIVHNEPIFLPIWLEYYSRFFDPADIYVLDHESTDGSTDLEGFNRIPVVHDRVDHEWMVTQMQSQQHRLLETHDVVLVTDVDEIVAPDPDWGTLGDYIDEFNDEFVTCQGYELIHMKDEEPPLDAEMPILTQRRHWFRNYAYDKPILATTPSTWFPGFHARRDGRTNYDDRLYLLHLHRMEYTACIERHRERRRMAWNQADLDGGYATHNRLVDDEQLEEWFYNDTGYQNWPVTIERVPDHWQTLL